MLNPFTFWQMSEWTCVDFQFSSEPRNVPSEQQHSKSDGIDTALVYDDRKSIVVYVNGEQRVIKGADANVTLASFLRESLGMTGVKLNCQEGGCGVCTVVISYLTVNGELEHCSCNACLRPLV